MIMRTRCLALLMGCLIFLSGCAASPPDSLVRKDTDTAHLVSADTRSLPADSMAATLYFRYGETAYLAAEERILAVKRDESPEKVLVQALLDGPAATASSLNPLFPPGTQVLAVTSQDDTLFVTFNEALLARYSDEPGDISNEPWKTEGPLRRLLCMESLTATLTEAGLCSKVQVLVHREKVESTSMRLHAGFYTRSGDETLLPVLTRNEDMLLTPHNAASALMTAWMTQDWAALYDLVARNAGDGARPDEQIAYEAFSGANILTSFHLSPGNVSLDGQSAVLSADATLRGQGMDFSLNGYPIHLTRESGLWKISYSRLIGLMNQN